MCWDRYDRAQAAKRPPMSAAQCALGISQAAGGMLLLLAVGALCCTGFLIALATAGQALR